MLVVVLICVLTNTACSLAGSYLLRPIINNLGDNAAEYLKASSSEFLMNRRTLGNESLIAVRTYYSKTDVTGTITVPDVNLPMNVYDCETGKIIGNVSPERPDFQCKVPARSCRLLYIGTEKQWNQRKF